MTLSAGAHLGEYEIIGLLGAGGMGEVYRALDGALGREVAIKVLPQAVASHPERLARFEREARLLASINHPNIAAVYGLERSSDRCFLVMELVRGETLAERGARGPLPLDQALPVFRQIAEALEAAHSQSIIHRDLKPANIMISGHGSVKILDFGLAKIVSEDSSMTQSPTLGTSATVSGVVMGTAPYMSPEQARGDQVDRRTDIWAFGCLLFESLTGQRAFSGRTTSDTIATILREDPDWSRIRSLPPGVQHLIRRCLQKNPNRRLHDIADARIELDETSTGFAPYAEASTAPRWLRRVGRKTLWAAGAAVVALIAISGAAIALRGTSDGSGLASAPARVTIAVPPGHVLESGRSPALAISPDGSLVVYAASAGSGRSSLFRRRLDEFTVTPIPATEGATTPFFSVDGRWLGFYADGRLQKLPIDGGVPLTISDAPPVWSATWGDNNTILFASTLPGSGLWLVSADGGEPIQITKPRGDESQHGYPQLLPGGRQALFSVRRQSAWHLARLELASREWTVLGSGRTVGEGAQYVRSGHLVYAQSGALVATPFDPATAALDRPSVPLLERLDTSSLGGPGFAIAADAGTLIYAPPPATPANRTLLRVDRDGRTAPLIAQRAAYEHPALSPDGRRLAVGIEADTGNDIWIVDLERGTRIRFTTGGTSAFPVWSADGSKVAFQSNVASPWNLFWKALDSGDAQPLLAADQSTAAASWPNTGADLLPGTLPTLSGAHPQFPMSWTRDGTIVFHERKPGGDRDIWVASADAAPVPFLLTTFDERSPRFSPDGRWIAYVSDESGRDEVYVQPFPGPGAKWLVSPDGGVDPLWSRDGGELFYRQDDRLMVAAVESKAEFSAGRPRALFELPPAAAADGTNYDVSRDGRWFVMTRGEQGAARTDLHLVLNWFGEIIRRVQP